jgi:hypothetical protein
MAGFGALDGVLCPATEAADRCRGPCGNRLADAEGAWCPTRHRPFGLVSCGHPGIPVPLTIFICGGYALGLLSVRGAVCQGA